MTSIVQSRLDALVAREKEMLRRGVCKGKTA